MLIFPGQLLAQQGQTGQEQQGEDHRRQQAVLQAVAPGGGDQSHQSRTGGAAQVLSLIHI